MAPAGRRQGQAAAASTKINPQRTSIMETEAGGRRSKRRRCAAPKIHHESAPASTALGAPDPTPAPATSPATQNSSQEPPSAGAGEREDHISRLPDAILGKIISLLPTKDGARTQILASPWRHLWRSAPLNLDHRDFLFSDADALAAAVSRVLSAHAGPGRRFCVPAGHLRDTVDAWLGSPALDGLEELELWCGHRPLPPERPLPPLPESVFRFSATLRVLNVARCRFPDGAAQAVRLPQLKQLALRWVSISERSLDSLIAGCPALDCLLINGGYGFGCVRINSLSLKSIGVRVYHPDSTEPKCEELIIQSAPCLETLIYLSDRSDDPGLHLSVISAPKLQTVGCPYDVNQLASRKILLWLHGLLGSFGTSV